MRIYFDASALVALAIGEAGAAGLLTWRLGENALTPCLSDFGRGEVIATVASHARSKRSAEAAVEEALDRLDTGTREWTMVSIDPSDVAVASDWLRMIHLGLRLPDAIHIAMARRLRAALVTLDKRQHAAAEALGVAVTGPLATRSQV